MSKAALAVLLLCVAVCALALPLKAPPRSGGQKQRLGACFDTCNDNRDCAHNHESGCTYCADGNMCQRPPHAKCGSNCAFDRDCYLAHDCRVCNVDTGYCMNTSTAAPPPSEAGCGESCLNLPCANGCDCQNPGGQGIWVCAGACCGPPKAP